MSPEYPKPVEQIVADYLERMKNQVKTLPAPDREELLREIQSHIYEAYRNEAGEDEVERILRVLRKLGEPAEVMASRVPEAMVQMAKRKNTPYYILLGILIALFGLPLGLGGLSILFGIAVTILALVLSYFVVASAFVISGVFGTVTSIIYMINPTLFDELSRVVERHGGHFTLFFGTRMHPQFEATLALFASLLLLGLGVLMFWGGRRIPRALMFLATRAWESVRRWAATAKKPRAGQNGNAAP